MPLVLPDLVGTLRSAFRVALATFNASGLTAARTVTLPDKSGTLAMLDDVGGGSTDWIIATSGQTLADDAPVQAVITTAQTFGLPTTIVAGDTFVLGNSPTSTAVATFDPGASRSIHYGTGLSLPVGETVTLAPGEQIAVLARTTTVLDLQTPGAVGPPGPAGAGASVTSTVTPLALAASAAIGTSAEAARADHVHARPTPADIGAAAASHTHDASAIVSGTIDPARLPVLPSSVQIVGTTIAGLTAGEQAQIGDGSIVTTTDGRRWVYIGSGSKTDEANYIVLADVTPDWSAIANRPTTVAGYAMSDFIASVRAEIEAALAAGANITITPSGSGATRTFSIAAAGGGGGAPGGTNRQVQFNNSGALGGSSNVRLGASSDNLELGNFFDQAAGGIPAAPAAGFGRWFSRSRAGRVLPHYMGPAGVDVALQPAMFGNSIYMWMPGTGTTLAINFATAWTARNSGTGAAQAHPARAATNAMTSMNRATFGTGTTATGSSGVQSSSPVAWRGNAANLGGFFYFSRFGVETFRSDIQVINGLSALNAALTGEPSVQNNSIGVCKDAADVNWQIFTRSGTTTTKTDTGLAVAAGTILDLLMFAPPNGNSITVRLVNAVDGTVYVDNLVITTNLPTNTAFLYAHNQIRSTTGTTAALLALNRIYVENDL